MLMKFNKQNSESCRKITGGLADMNYKEFRKEISYTWLKLDEQKLPAVHEFLCGMFATEDNVPVRDIHRCTDMMDVFCFLEKQKIVTKSKLSVLLNICSVVGGPSEMVKEQILQVTESNPNCLSPTCPCIPASQDDLAVDRTDAELSPQQTEIIDYLSEQLGDRWIDLGRKLPPVSGLIGELQSSVGVRQKDKIHELLSTYFRKRRGESAYGALLVALEGCSLNRQRDHILRLLS